MLYVYWLPIVITIRKKWPSNMLKSKVCHYETGYKGVFSFIYTNTGECFFISFFNMFHSCINFRGTSIFSWNESPTFCIQADYDYYCIYNLFVNWWLWNVDEECVPVLAFATPKSYHSLYIAGYSASFIVTFILIIFKNPSTTKIKTKEITIPNKTIITLRYLFSDCFNIMFF